MSQENVDAVRSSFDAWNRGDIDTWLGCAHPDIEFRTSGFYPGTDPIYRGHAELRRFWTSFREPWESFKFVSIKCAGLATTLSYWAPSRAMRVMG